MSINITIAGEDKTKKVSWESLKIYNILTSQVDKCSFKIRGYSEDKYIPKTGRSVVITDNGVKVFAGYIVRVDQTATEYQVLEYSVECVDYTRLLQKRLVVEVYKDLTVKEIIDQMTDRYCAGYGFNTDQVVCDIVVKEISFNYKPVQQCIEDLAKITAYDWYVDYDKNIVFKKSTTLSAPFNLTDTNGTYQFNSLRIRKDNSQIKNSIIVRGGTYYGSTLTVALECDGIAKTYPTSYKFRNIKATLTGNPLSIGIDFSSDADAYDVLYNFQEKVLKWKEDDIPSAGATLSVSGEPLLPVILKQKNPSAIGAMLSAEGVAGDYEFLITDNKIQSKEEARDRANAELSAYADTLEEGEFITETSGLKAGMTINIDSAAHDINESFTIREVQAVMFTPNQMKYKIGIISTRTLDMVAILQQLLLNQGAVDVNQKEILDKITSYFETITLTDTHIESRSHEPQTESMALSETLTSQINADVHFVVGPFAPPVGTLGQYVQVLDQSNQTAISTTTLYGAASWKGQSFTIGSTSDKIRDIVLKLKRTGTVSGNFEVLLCSTTLTSGEYKPNFATPLQTLTFLASDIPTTDTFLTCAFDISSTPNGVYAFVLKATGGTNTSNCITLYYSNTTAYAGGKYFSTTDSGANWSYSASADHYFKQYKSTKAKRVFIVGGSPLSA